MEFATWLILMTMEWAFAPGDGTTRQQVNALRFLFISDQTTVSSFIRDVRIGEENGGMCLEGVKLQRKLPFCLRKCPISLMEKCR